ncbi:MAG: UDP-2,3-diacylglucosamine diphosphatase [Gammaproteobacteria bacterium]|nr:UDP-2,3-diacylglucosamine diphosphatase [Gammaproteobacteria bacterium]
MSIAFISDLHLEPIENSRLKTFYDLLLRAQSEFNSLYIIGDLFEYWIGDDDQNPINKNIIQNIKSATDNGLNIFLIHGNRDFLLGSKFEEMTGIQIIDDMTVIEDEFCKIMVSHGDVFCTDDIEYQNLKKTLRSEQWIETFLSKTIEERIDFANQLRSQSAESSSNKAENIMDVNMAYVNEIIDKNKIDILIHGHTHRPAVHKLDSGASRAVLGSWENNEGWIIEYKQGNIELKSFPL